MKINTDSMAGKFTGTVEYLRSLGYDPLQNLNLPEVEVKADKVADNSNWKKYAIGAAIGAAIVYFVCKD